MKSKSKPRRLTTPKESVYRDNNGSANNAVHASAPPALPEYEPKEYKPDNDYWDLFEEVHGLQKCVFDNVRADTPLRQVFYLAIPEECIGDYRFPSRAGLQRAVDAFAALPFKEQRRILNGWRYERPEDRTNRADLQRDLNDGSVAAFAHIGAIPGEAIRSASHSGLSTGTTDLIHVYIRRGTRKPDTLAALWTITAFVEREWDRIAGDAWTQEFNERRRQADGDAA